MSVRLRLYLALIGLAIIVASVAAIVYVAWPVQPATDRYQPEPALFSPPAGASSDLPRPV